MGPTLVFSELASELRAVETRAETGLVAFQDPEVDVVDVKQSRGQSFRAHIEHLQELFDYEMKIALESSNIKHPT